MRRAVWGKLAKRRIPIGSARLYLSVQSDQARCVWRQPACKPGSVWPAANRKRDGHSSGTAVTGRLEQPTRATIRRRTQGAFLTKNLLSPLFGFAPGGACHAADVTIRAVRSYRTVSPLPAANRRRFIFCGAFPRVSPAGRYPAPCLYGARTFLRLVRSSGHPADWHRAA